MKQLRLLITEDDPTIRALYNLSFSEEVFEKRFAENGEIALDIYGSWRPDILILDIMMPVMTGFSVLKEIRKNIQDRKITIIMASSLNEKNDIKDCINLGIQGYIIKPFKYKNISDEVLAYYHRAHPGGDVSRRK